MIQLQMALLHRRSSSMPLFLQSMTNTMINLSYILSVVPQNLARRCCQSSWTTFLIFCYVSITTNQCYNKRDIKLIIGYQLDNQTRVIATHTCKKYQICNAASSKKRQIYTVIRLDCLRIYTFKRHSHKIKLHRVVVLK